MSPAVVAWKEHPVRGEKFFLMTEETGASAFVNFHPAVWCPWQHVPLTVQFHPTNCINCRWTRCSIEFIFLSPMPGPRMASTFPRGSGSVTGKNQEHDTEPAFPIFCPHRPSLGPPMVGMDLPGVPGRREGRSPGSTLIDSTHTVVSGPGCT
jgi:hypothetical protein